jgi:hypothetical protein
MCTHKLSFLGTFQPYTLYLWEYLDAHNLLKTSFQRLNSNVAARNGGKGVPSIIRSDKERPSDDNSTLGTNKSKHSPALLDNKISISIELLGESNGRVARIKSYAAVKNTLHNLVFNLRTQKMQMAVDQLKANRAFDNQLAQSLQEQIDEIDDEIKEYTANLHSMLELEMKPPPCKNLTPRRV